MYIESLKRRSKMLNDTFNSLKGVSCVPATGAMYLFPKFEFPKKLIKAAKEKGMEVDTFYAMELLNHTGVVRRMIYTNCKCILCNCCSVWCPEVDFVKNREVGI